MIKEDLKIRELQRAIASMVHKSSSRPPTLFLQQIRHCFKPKFSQDLQQDAEEFLGDFLSIMDPKPDPWVQNPFSLLVSDIQYTVVCCDCKNANSQMDPCMLMHMHIPQLQSTDIQSIVYNFFASEELMGLDIGVRCENCAKQTEHTRNQKIVRLGPACIVQLKLFDSEGQKLIPKIEFSDHVHFPCDEQTTAMSLQSVIVHDGKRLNSGHYMCYTRCLDGWLCISDEVVTKSTSFPKLRKSATPYLFFYQIDDEVLKGLDKRVYQLSKTFTPHLPDFER
jgi:ubiquitin C-terminal hydrolase